MNNIFSKMPKITGNSFGKILWSIILMTTKSTPKLGKPATAGQLSEILRKAPALFTGSASSIIYMMSAWGDLNAMGDAVRDPSPANLKKAMKEHKAVILAKAELDKKWRAEHPIQEVKTS